MKRKISLLLAALACVPMAACKKSNKIDYMHLSLDDTLFAFRNLTYDDYDSLFDEGYFGALKGLHDEYGAVFSLYTYNTVLEGVPDKYAEEFKANASWLKLGLHSNDHSYRMGTETYENGLAYWNEFVGHVERICGTTDVIDRMPRLEFYDGSKDCVLGMKEAKCGALGFLTRGYNTKAYYYGDQAAEYLSKNDYARDEGNGFLFLSTDMQLEETPDPYAELSKRMSDKAFKNKSSSMIIYSHEYYIYNGDSKKTEFDLLESCCKFAKDKGIAFGYPQEKEYAASKGDSLF